MEESPSWEADSYSASVVDPESSLPSLQEPVTGSYPEPDASSPRLSTLFP